MPRSKARFATLFFVVLLTASTCLLLGFDDGPFADDDASPASAHRQRSRHRPISPGGVNDLESSNEAKLRARMLSALKLISSRSHEETSNHSQLGAGKKINATKSVPDSAESTLIISQEAEDAPSYGAALKTKYARLDAQGKRHHIKKV
jgi:hypothetical protein